MVKIIDKKGKFDKLEANVKGLKKRSVKVGIWGSDTVKGVSVTDYAGYNEFGTSRGIPARPFMQKTYEDNYDEMMKFVEFLGGQIIDGTSDADRALRVLGETYQAKIQQTIRDAKTWAVPNNPSTVAKKGSSSPLIDTGRMVNSVRYEVS